MAAAVLMPKAGISVESCIITQWLKQPGDTIAKGDVLFSYETDKASFECESTEDGQLLEIFYGDGDEVPVLVNVCAVGAPGDDVSGLRPGGQESAPTAQSAPVQEAPAAAVQQPPAAEIPPASGDIKISPRAKNLAAKQGIDVRFAAPTGPYGRVIEQDIRTMMEQGAGSATGAAFSDAAAAQAGSFAGTGIGGRVGVNDLTAPLEVRTATAVEVDVGLAYEDVKFTGIRKVISKSMTASLTAIPQLTHNFSFNATEIMAYRAKLKKNGEAQGLPNITLNDMVLYAVSRILMSYPALNAHMLDPTTIRYFRNVNLGMAVDTERGLMVPVIKNANRKTLTQISIEAKSLAKQAQTGTLSPDDMSGGTFTVSNLGALGVESFTPVINPPETGILGVDTIIQRPVEVDGEIRLYPAMGISLTYDHRAIDGAPASRFARELCRALENFTLLLAQ
ncbi:2-oxo acid dehydrogenase subunit E2 [Ruminococcaceae bacterium OttesenSCG-928-L11]|nr:2-oxo acid dehydrogenase subunit E2 [Ruminococcaceae bacterium OttesenSCG-928-L11]